MKFAAAFTFGFGLLMAMSSGPYFPWANLVGVAIFAVSVPLSWRIER